MAFTYKPSQAREVQFTTDFPQPPPDASPATRQWLLDFVERMKADHQTIEDAFAKIRDEMDALNVSTIAALTARVAALEAANAAPDTTLIFDRNVAPDAAIQETKIALNYPTHSNANDPTAAQKAALAGTVGDPSDVNRYVTNSDPRLSAAPDSAESSDILAIMADHPQDPKDDSAEVMLTMDERSTMQLQQELDSLTIEVAMQYQSGS